MTDAVVLRARIIDFGRRNAPERLAHMFYELLIRYRMIGLAEDNSYPFPATQQDLADAAGLTHVHVSRTLRKLREDGLVELAGKCVMVKDAPGLKRLASFSADYLHLRRTEAGAPEISERASDLV